MPPKPKPPRAKLETPEQIRVLANKKGITIELLDDDSEQAQRGSISSYSRKAKRLTIVVSLLEKRDKPLLLDIIKKAFNGGGLIWKKEKQQTLDSYKEYSSNNPYQNILEFFDGILPKDDFSALKMALYLRSEQDKRQNISTYKKDIRDRFGDRGANIANLCTAEYFELEFMPLYNLVPNQVFHEYYETAVGKKARALFVHRGMDRQQLAISFEEMLAKAIKYHMEDFRVHGLGAPNVQTITAFFENLPKTPEDNYVAIKAYEKSDAPVAIEYVVKIIPDRSAEESIS